jgi:hypothetical protein
MSADISSVFDRKNNLAKKQGSSSEESFSWIQAWNDFWFTPQQPYTICLMRLFTGCLIAYITFTYSYDLLAFVGPDGLLDKIAMDELRKDNPIFVTPPNWFDNPKELDKAVYIWSPYIHLTSTNCIWAIHIGILLANICMALGLFTRASTILSWMGAMFYVQRCSSSLFGMDAMIMILLFYMMLAPGWQAYSLDSLIIKYFKRKAGEKNWNAPPEPLISTNVVIRMVQVHFCIIYMAAATSKLQGAAWWNGTALWGVLANYSFNPMHIPAYTALITFLAKHRLLWEILMTTGCVFTIILESSFPFLVWHKNTRWLMISGSVLLHFGIAMLMGLIVFSLCMMTLVLSFVPAETSKSFVERWILRKPLENS